MNETSATHEFETDAEAIEVVILWGEAVLHVEHLAPPRSFSVGEALDARGRRATDYLIGKESLGCARLPVVVADGARVAVVAGGAEQGLAPGESAHVRHRDFGFVVTRTRAARRIGVGPERPRWREHAWFAAATAAHLAVLALFQALPPRAAALSVERLDTRLRLVPIETTSPETFLDVAEPERRQEGGEAGRAHDGEAGEMGEKQAPKAPRRFGVPGPQDNSDPLLPKEAVRDPRDERGILDVLGQFARGWSAPTSPYARDAALGRDPMAALGALMGVAIGESGGLGGLGPIGTGRGSGGDGLGTIGLGRIGTIGDRHGRGGGGAFTGRLPERIAKVPDKVTIGRADVRGGLSKEVIQRVIRRHVPEVRHCYEQGLANAPDLEGRVTMKLVIAPSGAVQAAATTDSSLGNASVEACIARAVGRWSFPAPEGGGIVIVSYPFTLQQSGK